jgi:hypothetical protein
MRRPPSLVARDRSSVAIRGVIACGELIYDAEALRVMTQSSA